jgi:SOS-response transcriptional repressor LexA
MAISATPRQMDVLRFVHGYQQAKGYSPSHAELAEGIGSPKGGATQDRLLALEERGFIRCLYGKHRAIEVLEPPAIPRDPDGAPLYFVRGEWS